MSGASEPSTTNQGSARTPSRRLGLAGLLFLGISVLAIGSLPPGLSLLFGLGASLLVGVWLLALPGHGPPDGLAPRTLALLALWTLLQCVPLPFWLLSRISPESAQIWHQALTLAGETRTWVPLSLAPGQTLMEAAKWGGYAGLCMLGAWWARHRGLTFLCWAVVGLSLTVGVVTVLHGIFDAQTIFGIYKPIHNFPRWTRGPLLNVNHLSAYLSLGVYAAFALLLGERSLSLRARAVLLISAAALVVGVVALASRAGVFALTLGGLLMPVVLLEGSQGKRLQQRRQLQRKALLTLLGVFGVGIALALYGFGDGIVKGLGEKNFSKIQTARDSLPMIRDFWLTGVGRGAFEGPFFYYKSPGDHEAWARPENILIQWASEWGLPISLLAFSTLFFALFRAHYWRSSRTARLLALGLCMLLLHNLLDFNLEVPAVAGLAFVLFGALTGLQRATLQPSHHPARQRALATLVAASTAAAAAVGWLWGPELPLLLRAEAYALLKRAQHQEEHVDLQPFQRWIKRYPSDPYFAAAAGAVISRSRPVASIRWFGWAIRRGPNVGVIRLGLAEALARAGYRQQGLLEVRLAMERDPTVLPRAIPLARALAQTSEELLACAPPEPQRLLFLEGVARKLPPEGELFRSLRQHILQQTPCVGFLQESVMKELLEDYEAQRGPCAGPRGREACRRTMEDVLARMQPCTSLRELTSRLRSDLLWTVGERETAVQELEASCDTSLDLTACLRRVAERSADLQDQERLRRVVRVVTSRRCQDPPDCAAAWSWAARLHERAGDLPSALVAATKAAEQDSNNLDLRYQQAMIALRMGAHERAEALLKQILARRPDHKQARAKLNELNRGRPTP
ncbi:MAG: O-antigen ligase family protein [Myxococcales bacterium]|nr:O-antigen ligase family protein [Polyangiaceae bacterium]MDW8250482.1 O-antigen ligase family protein [Myxococcales bacterium]